MSKKKEYAKKFVVEVIGLKNIDVLDEILHPEYFAKHHITQEDRLCNSRLSFWHDYTDTSIDSDKILFRLE